MNQQNPEIEIARMVKKQLDTNFGAKKAIDEEIISFVKGLPSSIMQNGLVQTFVFLKSKANEKENNHYNVIYNILKEYYNKHLIKNQGKPEDVVNHLVDNLNDIGEYVYYQKQMIDYSIWLKRFVLAFYEKAQATEQ